MPPEYVGKIPRIRIAPVNHRSVYQHFAVIGEQAADIGGGYEMDDYIMEKAL